MNPLRTEAQKLRDTGYSYNMINAKLGIAKSTLSNWFKDRLFTPNQEVLQRIQYGPIISGERAHNKRVQEIQRMKNLGIQELGNLSKRDLWLLGLGLYIGEGNKSHETICIVNSDPKVIGLAIKWFKDVCGLKNENITVAIHLYPDNNIWECFKFWGKVTGIPIENFRKIQIDTRKDKLLIKNRKLPYGTAHIRVICKGDSEKGVKLFRKLLGWIEGALSQIDAGIV